MPVFVFAIDQPSVSPCTMPDRFRHEITYFMTPGGQSGAPELAAGEYWVRLDEARQWLDEGCFSIVSPLDSESRAELELSEEQEAWLEWMVAHGIQRVRLEAAP